MQNVFAIVKTDNEITQAKVSSQSKDNAHSLRCNFECDNIGFDAVANCDSAY